MTDWQGTLKMIDELRRRGATSISIDGVKVEFPALIEPQKPPTPEELERERKAREADAEETLNWSAG